MPPDVKPSGLPNDSSVDGNHYVILNDPSGPTTKRSFLSTLAAFFFNQVNIPDGSGSVRTRMVDTSPDFIASGGRWSGDAYGSTRNASMTAAVVYINGRRISISAVAARSFTASNDTYVDVLDNGDGTGSLVYTTVANNAASPALAANSLRMAIVVAGASNILNAGSINMGQFTSILPTNGTVAYTVTDTLGNVIGNRDAAGKLLAFKRSTTSFNTTTAFAAVTGMSATWKCPPNLYKVKVSYDADYMTTNAGNTGVNVRVYDTSVAGAMYQESASNVSGANSPAAAHIQVEIDVVPGTTYTFIIGANVNSGAGFIAAQAAAPMAMRVERY